MNASYNGGLHYKDLLPYLKADHRERCVPLALHGDGTPVAGHCACARMEWYTSLHKGGFAVVGERVILMYVQTSLNVSSYIQKSMIFINKPFEVVSRLILIPVWSSYCDSEFTFYPISWGNDLQLICNSFTILQMSCKWVAAHLQFICNIANDLHVSFATHLQFICNFANELQMSCTSFTVHLQRQKWIWNALYAASVRSCITGAGKSWGRSGDFWEWCSLLSTGPSWQCVFLIFSISSIVRAGNSLRVALQIVAWSFKVLYSGKFPYTNWDGSPTHDPRHTSVSVNG